MAEIRRGKRKKKKIEETTGQKIKWPALFHSVAINIMSASATQVIHKKTIIL